MNKKRLTALNRSNKDIWALLQEGVKSRNLALIEVNLKRLNALQEEYLRLLNLNDFEIQGLKNELQAERELALSFEKEWITEVSKRNGTYERLKDRIDTLFGK
jgi:hypothetical protein